jgi:hypothetical protein
MDAPSTSIPRYPPGRRRLHSTTFLYGGKEHGYGSFRNGWGDQERAR